jgi:nitroreductase
VWSVMDRVAPSAPTPSDSAVFQRLAATRRSVRVYERREVARELTRALMDLAGRAPSNFNRQPWRFVVADTPAWCDAVNGLIRRAVERVEESDTAGELFHVLNHVKTWLYPLETSPVLVLAFYKPSPEYLDEQLSSILESGGVAHYNPNLLSLGMAIQNLLLAAHALGLSACMHSGPLPFLRGQINRLLRLPPQLQLAGLISLGYPAETPKVPAHRDLDRTVTFLEEPVHDEWRAAHAPTDGE